MTARKTHLREVAAGEAPPEPAKPKTLAQAIESGTYLEILCAQRRQMVSDLANANGPALAALHRQIALHSKEIEALEAASSEEADGANRDVSTERRSFDASAI